MKLRQLKHFMAAIEAGSLTRAAEREGVTQQAISKSLARLETELGARLIERAARGVAPTRIGEVVADHARAVLAEAGHLQRAVDAELGLKRGRLVVGLSPIAAVTRPGRIIAEFAAAHPSWRIDVEAGIDRHFTRALHAGEIDLALASATEPPDPLILMEELGREPWVIAGRTGHPLLSSAEQLADLSGARWIIGRNMAVVEADIKQAFRQAGLSAPAPGIATTSVLYALETLRQSEYLAILPRAVTAFFPGLLARSFAGCDWTTPVLLMRRRRASLAPGVRQIIAALKAGAAGEGDGRPLPP